MLTWKICLNSKDVFSKNFDIYFYFYIIFIFNLFFGSTKPRLTCKQNLNHPTNLTKPILYYYSKGDIKFAPRCISCQNYDKVNAGESTGKLNKIIFVYIKFYLLTIRMLIIRFCCHYRLSGMIWVAQNYKAHSMKHYQLVILCPTNTRHVNPAANFLEELW